MYIFLYMILHDYVKQYKYKKTFLKCHFYLRRGDFIIFLMISQLNAPLQKKSYQNTHPQLIHMSLEESMIIKGIL